MVVWLPAWGWLACIYSVADLGAGQVRGKAGVGAGAGLGCGGCAMMMSTSPLVAPWCGFAAPVLCCGCGAGYCRSCPGGRALPLNPELALQSPETPKTTRVCCSTNPRGPYP